ncbi:THUMP domain-containing class I SAM-dependent RNA methyltransferase [Devosia ginsengisoli]|uniref:Class I SAM-dependent RNA methyltransferase n=1 Tax=Devosia ginsengisoli TaxID=400770 RepID=A0A5B8LTQ1_9HYPH|nr:class I SAM-dependent RNA methyltransferase [Devosia ginsengisoli]QDZ11054.1 class I SAM-dependent RNA methyltransferase [Devosia ginsengisoli]
MDTPFEIYLVGTPGLETPLCDEARAAGFDASVTEGGVAFMGSWPDVWRANLTLRGATRVLARVASFRAMHLAQLDKRARKVEWASLLRPDVPVTVEASCKRSRIYHAGAASQRVATAIAETLGAPIAEDAAVRVMVRIEDDLVTISLDTTGESLHKRGFKAGVAKAPMRETMAAMFLRQCGYDGSQTVLDPMCGSGTFVIEAAEIALGLMPGRSRSFAFEHLPGFDRAAWDVLRAPAPLRDTGLRFHGSDRDPGAVRMARENAERSGVSAVVQFEQQSVETLSRPDGPPGLIIINPPYGTRIGNKAPLLGLYRTMGNVIRAKFAGWRVGIVTTDKELIRATGLGLELVEPTVLHGGLRVGLWCA